MESTIGALEEETYAYHVILGLAIGYPIAMVLLGGIQFGTYLIYNRSQHPFKVLVENYKPAKKTTQGQEIELKPVLPKKPTETEEPNNPNEPNEPLESEALLQVHETTSEEQTQSKSLPPETPKVQDPSEVPEVSELDTISKEVNGEQEMSNPEDIQAQSQNEAT